MSMPKSDKSSGTTANGFRLGPVRSALQSSIRNIRSTSSRRTSSFGSSRNSLRQPIRRSSSRNLIDLPRPGSETTSGKPKEPRRGQELATLEIIGKAPNWPVTGFHSLVQESEPECVDCGPRSQDQHHKQPGDDRYKDTRRSTDRAGEDAVGAQRARNVLLFKGICGDHLRPIQVEAARL